MAEKPDYYQVLGIAKTATPEEIDKAFKKLAFQNHPDKMRGKTTEQAAAAEKLMALANEAKVVLLDEQKRRTYDSYGHEGLANLASGKSGGTGQSYTDAAGPVTVRERLSEEGIFDFFEKRAGQRKREEATPAGDGLTGDQRRAIAAAERARQRELRRGGGVTTPSVTETEKPAPVRPSDDFRQSAEKLDAAARNLTVEGMAAVPLDALRKFRENLQDFVAVVDKAIEKAEAPKNKNRR